jgi:hypothetical protein
MAPTVPGHETMRTGFSASRSIRSIGGALRAQAREPAFSAFGAALLRLRLRAEAAGRGTLPRATRARWWRMAVHFKSILGGLATTHARV